MDPRYPRRYALCWNTDLTFDWLHGGGHAPGAFVWRFEGWVMFVVTAGQA